MGTKRRRGFTIIELLVVIAVIGILGSIVTSAAFGSIKSARAKRTSAMRMALEQGIAAYYAQEGKWPDAIESKANGNIDGDTYMFSADECDQIFRQVVGKGFGKSGRRSVLVDGMALFVAKSADLGNSHRGCYDNHGNPRDTHTFCAGRKCINGVDFSTAVARSGTRHIRFNEMAFGYQGTEAGKFCRFWVVYNAKADSVNVTTRGPDL